MRKPWPRTFARHGTTGLAAGLLLCLGAGLLLVPADAAPGDKPTPSRHQVQQAQSAARVAAKAVGTGKARLVQVQAEMDALNRDAQIAAEAYDGAVYHLGLADQAARQARKRANAAQAQYDAAQKIVSRFAVAAYRSGADFGSADVYLGVDGPGGAVTRADIRGRRIAVGGGGACRRRTALRQGRRGGESENGERCGKIEAAREISRAYQKPPRPIPGGPLTGPITEPT